MTNEDCLIIKFQNLLAHFDKVTQCKKQCLNKNYKKSLSDLKQ